MKKLCETKFAVTVMSLNSVADTKQFC